MSAASFSGYLAGILGSIFIWPQVVRVYARGNVEGVSGASQLVSLSGTMMWLAYGIGTDSLPMVLSNANIEIALLAITAMLVRKKVVELWLPVTVVGVSVMFATLFARTSPGVIGMVGVVIGTPSILPQLLRAVRTKRLYGVSIWSNLLLASMGTSWFVHGIIIGDPLVSYPNLVLVPSASFIAWRAWRSRSASLSVLAA